MNPEDRIVVALDVENLSIAEDLIGRLDAVSFYKVGLPLYIRYGPVTVEMLKDRGKRVFLDLKMTDIRTTVSRVLSELVRMDVDMVTVMGGDAHSVRGTGLSVLSVVRLTTDEDDEIEDRARRAVLSGCQGVVCPARDVVFVREAVGWNMTVVCPGIRPAGHDRHEHLHAATPAQAVSAGADYIVVGRPVYQAPDPVAVVDGIVDELRRDGMS